METDYFSFRQVMPGSAEFEAYLEARYQVFCEELGRVDAAGALSGNGLPIETDEFDAISCHFVARHKISGGIAGFMRVILPSAQGLNVSKRYVIDNPRPSEGAIDNNVAEISRLAITHQFRRRRSDELQSAHGDPKAEMTYKPEGMRQHHPELVLGMYREVYRLCLQRGLDYCVAAMDHRYSRLLTTLGFPFMAVGPVNKAVTPPRRVYLIHAKAMERSLSRRENCILAFMQADLSPEPALVA